MTDQEANKVIYQLAEEAAYSAKGHFKSADWIRVSLSVYIFVPLFTSLIIFVVHLPDLADRILSFIGLLFASLALSSSRSNNRDRVSKEIKNHMELGNRYLELFKRMRTMAAGSGSPNEETLDDLQKQISELDAQTNKLRINTVGYWWTRLRINREMDLDWLNISK